MAGAVGQDTAAVADSGCIGSHVGAPQHGVSWQQVACEQQAVWGLPSAVIPSTPFLFLLSYFASGSILQK